MVITIGKEVEKGVWKKVKRQGEIQYVGGKMEWEAATGQHERILEG